MLVKAAKGALRAKAISCVARRFPKSSLGEKCAQKRWFIVLSGSSPPFGV